MEIESRLKEIAAVAEANSGRIMFAESLAALLRHWYMEGIKDAGGHMRPGSLFRIVHDTEGNPRLVWP